MKTQLEWVLEQLKAGRKLTSKDALDEWAISRLSAIICKLRGKGWRIDNQQIEVRNRFGQICYVAEYCFSAAEQRSVRGLAALQRLMI